MMRNDVSVTPTGTNATVLVLLALALVLALQPWSVLAGLLLVVSRRGLLKASLFLSGWVLALTVVAVGSLLMAPMVSSGSSRGLAWAEVVVGLGALATLGWRWRRPSPASGAEPAWMARLDTMRPVWAFVLGGFLPNYVIVVVAMGEIAAAGWAAPTPAIATTMFIAVASLGAAVPLLVLAVRRDRAPELLGRWREWLLMHNRAVLFGVGALLAVVVVVQGIIGLATIG
jgi:hypothetical protein